MAVSAGDRLGPYEIIAPLGSGGMGDVYAARDTRLNRTVAIKLLHPGGARDPELRTRFEREARAIAALSHPHICVVYDVGEYEGEPFLVMEHLDGETLDSRLARGPLPLPQALRYGKEIAEALDSAHRHDILHRDLKPSNVMLTKTGAKLLDFGLAKLRPESASPMDPGTTTALGTTIPGTVFGTLPYMAPERIQGKPADARADIFAFGAVLYEMLSGHRAFEGTTQAGVMNAVLKDEPPPIDGIPPALDRVIRRCLAPDPDDRWQTARDLVESLAWVSETPATPPAPVPSRRRIGPIAAAAVVLAAAIWGLYAAARLAKTPPAPAVIVLMDSTLPERVYDPDTRKSGGTNSDDITDALRDLPVELHKETTSALWRREDQMLRQRPTLVMMHLSSFAQPATEPGSPLQPLAVERLREFLGFVGLGNSQTRFIVYTRGFPTEAERETWVGDTVARFPALKGRLEMLHVPGGDQATFRDPKVREAVRARVKALLGLS